MSFSIQAAGRIADVIEQVKAHEFTGDSSQVDAVKALIVAELEAWAPDSYWKGAIVEASGHHDGHVRNLTLSLRPLHLKEPKAEVEADSAGDA